MAVLFVAIREFSFWVLVSLIFLLSPTELAQPYSKKPLSECENQKKDRPLPLEGYSYVWQRRQQANQSKERSLSVSDLYFCLSVSLSHAPALRIRRLEWRKQQPTPAQQQ